MASHLRNNSLYVPVKESALDFYVSDTGYLCANYPITRVLSEIPVYKPNEGVSIRIEGNVYSNKAWYVKLNMVYIDKQARKMYREKFNNIK
jgi:hypothetical protein